MATGKFISGFFEDTTEITLGNNKNQNKEESICPPNSGSTQDREEDERCASGLRRRQGRGLGQTFGAHNAHPQNQTKPEFKVILWNQAI